MDTEKNINTIYSYKYLMEDHQGGGFVVAPGGNTIDTFLDETATASVLGLKKFIVSIYNQYKNIDDISLIFLVNPTDINFGQTFIAGDSYAREGWVSSLWGRGQPTILANGSTAAFYVGGKGLTALSRKSSYSFRNFMTIVGLFKNNGYYFLSGPENKDLFEAVGVNRGRVISVMDLIKISYDGVDYIGSFSSFTIDETAEAPFRFNYNFEFIVSGLRGEPVEGHLKMCVPSGCNTVDSIIVQTSGAYDYTETLSLDTTKTDILFDPQVSREGVASIQSLSVTELAKISNYSSKFITLPPGANKDAKSLVSFLQNDSTIPVRHDLETTKQVCDKRKAVKNFLESIDSDKIDKTVSAYAASVGRSNYTFTDKETETILMLESAYESDGTWVARDSSCGAKGPAQIMPNTYVGIYSAGNGEDFENYMAKFNYNSQDCKAVKSDPSKLRDPKFNYIVHKYIGLQKGGYTSPTIVKNTSDPVDRLTLVLANYNGGPRPFSRANNIAIESAIYAKTGAYIQSVNCS